MVRIPIFNQSARERISNAVRKSEKTPTSRIPDARRGRPPVSGSSTGGGLQRGVITAIKGTAEQPRYDAALVSDPNTTVTNKRPRSRPFGTEIDMTADSIVAGSTTCWMYADSDGVWQLSHVEFEVVDPLSCEDAPQGLTRYTENTLSLQEFPRNAYKPRSIIAVDCSVTVSSGTQNQYGFLVATFPYGRVRFGALNFEGTVSAPTITTGVRLAFATNDATGSSGTSFAANKENIAENLQQVALSSGGTTYQRYSPYGGNLNTDIGDMMKIWDGTSSRIEIYINLAPNANWGGSEAVRIEGDLALHWINAGNL